MDRRNAITRIAMIGGSALLLSHCNLMEKRVPIALKKLNVSFGEEDLMKSIVGAMLPPTDLPGAVEMDIHNFVWVMADDCLDEGGQRKFMRGLRGFENYLDFKKESGFTGAEHADQVRMLELGIVPDPAFIPPANDEGTPVFTAADVAFYLHQTKSFAIQGFMESRYIMTERMPYKLVPVTYSGCVQTDPSKRINIYG